MRRTIHKKIAIVRAFARPRQVKSLSMEHLESRYVFDGELGQDVTHVLPMLTTSDRTAEWAKYDAPVVQDKQRIDLRVEVFYKFSAMAEMSGSIVVNSGSRTATLHHGETASFTIAARSIEELLEADNTSFQSLTRDQIYGTYLTVKEALYQDTRAPGATFPTWTLLDDRHVSYSLYRYVSAVFPNIQEAFPGTASNVSRLAFEPTRIDVDGNGNFKNSKSVGLRTYFDVTAIDPPGRPFDVSNNGSLIMTYWPDSSSASNNGPVSIKLFGGPTNARTEIGAIEVQGSVISPRTWWIDSDGLAERLRLQFPSWPVDFDAMALRVVQRIDAALKIYVGEDLVLAERTVVRDQADMRINILPVVADLPTPGQAKPQFDNSIPRLFQQHILSDESNPASKSYWLGQVAERFNRLNFGSERTAPFVPIALNINEISQYNVETHLYKVLVHELGHAVGFFGHIHPGVAAGEFGRKDFMQEGFRITLESDDFDFIESVAFLQLMAGAWSTDAVETVVDQLRETNSMFFRWHELEFNQGNYGGGPVATIGDYTVWKMAFGSTLLPGSGADGNYNGVVDAADYTVWRDHLVAASVSSGDFNGDGRTTQDDYLQWKDSFAELVSPGTVADGSGNGVVDAADYTIWRDSLEDLDTGTFSGDSVSPTANEAVAQSVEFEAGQESPHPTFAVDLAVDDAFADFAAMLPFGDLFVSRVSDRLRGDPRSRVRRDGFTMRQSRGDVFSYANSNNILSICVSRSAVQSWLPLESQRSPVTRTAGGNEIAQKDGETSHGIQSFPKSARRAGMHAHPKG